MDLKENTLTHSLVMDLKENTHTLKHSLTRVNTLVMDLKEQNTEHSDQMPASVELTEQLAAVPELANLGPLFKSSQPVEITESETEYYVQCIKHTFSHYIVFQVSPHGCRVVLCGQGLTPSLPQPVKLPG